MIGIAATATVLIVAIIAGGLYWLIRRRKRRAKGKSHERSRSMQSPDIESTSLDDRTSKAPLIQQEHITREADYRSSPVPRYDDNDDAFSNPPSIPHRTMSTSTTRSLPPSYAAAVRTSTDSDAQVSRAPITRSSYNDHRPVSSSGGSGGLRPLTLVASQQQQPTSRGNSRPTTPEPTDGHLSTTPQHPSGRPRAASRFREEDLDM